MQPLLNRLAAAAGRQLALDQDALLVEIHAYAAADPRFTELPPTASVSRQLALAGAFIGSEDVTIWRVGEAGEVEQIAQLERAQGDERMALVATAAIGHATEQWFDGDELIAAVPISRWQQPVAALVARLPRSATSARTAAAILRATATRLAQVLEREMLLERNAAHDEILTATADRRLVRLGYDLHDGPTQDLIVLAGDLERLRRQISEHGLVDCEDRQRVCQSCSAASRRPTSRCASSRTRSSRRRSSSARSAHSSAASSSDCASATRSTARSR